MSCNAQLNWKKSCLKSQSVLAILGALVSYHSVDLPIEKVHRRAHHIQVFLATTSPTKRHVMKICGLLESVAHALDLDVSIPYDQLRAISFTPSLDSSASTSAAFRHYLTDLLNGLNPLHLFSDASKAQAGAVQHEGQQLCWFSRELSTSDRGSSLREAQALLLCLQHIPRHLLRLSTLLVIHIDNLSLLPCIKARSSTNPTVLSIINSILELPLGIKLSKSFACV